MENEQVTTRTSSTIASASWLGLFLAIAAAGLQLATASISESSLRLWSGGIAVSLAVAGLAITGQAVAMRTKNFLTLVVAAITALAACYGIREEWDSIRLVPWVMTWVAGAAAIIILLPSALQKLAVSCFVLFHFLGVLSAITSPHPQSWLSSAAWTYAFRPYLFFTYANNAYQFYSPEPGPASLLWFCVELQDGDKVQKVWFKVPRKPETHLDPLAIEFFRRLSITEAVNQSYSNGPTTQALERRQTEFTIPHHGGPKVGLLNEYRPLQEHARRILGSYVRHVAHLYDPDLETNPNSPRVRGIKVYRVLHQMLEPNDFAERGDPYDPTTYYPYFLGEYDAQGRMKNNSDPMLYWLVPILRKSTVTVRPGQQVTFDNFLALHAGSDPFQDDNP